MASYPERLKHPSGATMSLERVRLLVSVRGPAPTAAANLRNLGLEPELPSHTGASQASGRQMERLNNTTTRTWMRTVDGRPYDRDRIAEIAKQKDSPIEWVAPVYRLLLKKREEYLSILPQVLLIKFQRPTSSTHHAALLKRFGLREDEQRSKYLRNYHYCLISDPWESSALDLQPKIIAESEIIADARFETMPMFVPTAYVPNDALYVDQWNMEQIHAGGTGQTGWNVHRGDPNVIVCVLDEGCDLTHPDLSFTPTPSGINLGTMAPDGSPTGNHGTACAGIAAAHINNTEGVAGVAGGCTILPVAFDAWTDVEVAAGIQYAADNGARVISMSFGWDAWDAAIIDPAIQYAFDANVVMCVATHNDNADIRYPATNPLVIACGASDQVDNRKSPASPDGEWWGSNFGPEISVVAPGVLCPTTDRQGNVGYNTAAGTAGDYVMDFNGTSAATPHVAGLAALLISCENTLTNVEVRAIIESTAEKVGTVAYAVEPNQPNGTWNEQMGYGRINVHEALRVLCKRCELDIKRLLIDDKRLLVDEKPIFWDVNPKLERFKEKERIDEIKGRVGYENPEIFDPRIYERLVERLDRLEQQMGKGQPFIRPGERPPVGEALASRARKRRK